MNAVPRSALPQRHQSRKPTANSRVMQSRAASPSTVTNMPPRMAGKKVEKLNTAPPPTPAWLSPLLFLQRSSDILTFVLVASTLTLYAWTVYTQQQWTQEYRKLENLQRDERYLTTTNEVIKNQLAQQAEKPSTGLVAPTPAKTIFLQPAPQRQPPTARTKTVDPDLSSKAPLGY